MRKRGGAERARLAEVLDAVMISPMDARSLILAYYQAFNRADWRGMLNLLSDGVVHEINQGGTEIGKEKFRVFLEHMEQCYKERLEEIVVMTNVEGDRCAAEFVVVGTYLRTDGAFPEARGQHYRLPAGAFLGIANGKIERVATVYNVKDWLRQVEGVA
jgi:steroid delta-isomerase-like uncharacterized protein